MSKRLYLATCVAAATTLIGGAMYLLPISETAHDFVAGHNYHPAAWAEVKPVYQANRLPLLLHLAPGMGWMLLALFQVRERNRGTLHRWRGRVALLLALASMIGVVWLNLIAGVSYGGALEQATVVVFAALFTGASAAAFYFIRKGDVERHRRFMLRAVTYGASVGLIRLLWYPLVRFDLFMEPAATRRAAFGIVFALAMGVGAALIEVYLRQRQPALLPVTGARELA
jgi:uncharacterized membrane protein